MIAAVAISNSKISLGLFENDEIICNACIHADIKKTSDEYLLIVEGILKSHGITSESIKGAAVLSVVPLLTDVIIDTVRKLAGDIHIVVLGRGSKSGVAIKVDNPSELGGDIVANAAAVVYMLKDSNNSGTPCIIIDMGMASTVFAVNSRGELIGGSIFAGVGMSTEVLRNDTAQLPSIGIAAPQRAIGKNTRESVCSGIVLGNAFMLDGFIDRFCKDMKCENNAQIFITGEYAQTVMPLCTHKMIYVPHLTLNGLYIIYKNNTR